jgi:hypothetical protein
MSDWIKNPTNQVHQAANGRFYALWRGQVVYAPDGTVRHFETEQEARALLARCDAAGSITQ